MMMMMMKNKHNFLSKHETKYYTRCGAADVQPIREQVRGIGVTFIERKSNHLCRRSRQQAAQTQFVAIEPRRQRLQDGGE